MTHFCLKLSPFPLAKMLEPSLRDISQDFGHWKHCLAGALAAPSLLDTRQRPVRRSSAKTCRRDPTSERRYGVCIRFSLSPSSLLSGLGLEEVGPDAERDADHEDGEPGHTRTLLLSQRADNARDPS